MNKVKNFTYYQPFAVKLDRCVGSCNALNDLLVKYVFQIKQKVQI